MPLATEGLRSFGNGYCHVMPRQRYYAIPWSRKQFPLNQPSWPGLLLPIARKTECRLEICSRHSTIQAPISGFGRTQTVSVFAFPSIIHWRAAQRRINHGNRKPQFSKVDVHSGNTAFQCGLHVRGSPGLLSRHCLASCDHPTVHQRARQRHLTPTGA
jgi:hypothetical protein